MYKVRSWGEHSSKWGPEGIRNAYNWLGYIGYYDTYKGMRRKGRFGPLSPRKKNWGVYRLAEYMSVKHPEAYTVWRTKWRLKGEK